MKDDYEEVSLFKNPITVLSTLIVIIYEQLVTFLGFLKSHKFLLLIGLAYIGLNFIEGPHSEVYLIIILSILNTTTKFSTLWLTG
jgi:hypothetical protein